MIDPWKFNPLSEFGKKATKMSEIPYLNEILGKVPQIIENIKKIREEVKNGNKELIDNSNELFL